jgi:hypothetical protein
MSYISRKISGIQTQSTFTAKVIQDNSPKRYANTTFKSQTFTVGYEYTGINLFKGQNRPPKLRILSIFKPLVTGNPNANNDTYVAFSVYDYTLGRFRGPACGRVATNSPFVYYDYYIMTIDKFGKNYGNVFTSDSGSSVTTFTAPSPSYSTTLYTTLRGGLSLTITSGHYTGCFVLASVNNTTVDFNGFFSLSGLNGTYCFYTIGENGVAKEFRNTKNDSTYTSNTAPYYTPVTNKFNSEWRCSPICDINRVGYSPLVRPISRGGIRYLFNENPNPANDFNSGLGAVTDVWVQADYTEWLPFFGGKLFTNDGGEQGASGYAPTGYYAISDQTYYAQWSSDGYWLTGASDYTAGGGGGGGNFVKYIFLGPFSDPTSACDENGDQMPRPNEGWIDASIYGQPDFGAGVFGDNTGSSPAFWVQGNYWFKVFDENFNPLNYVLTFDANGVISMTRPCKKG